MYLTIILCPISCGYGLFFCEKGFRSLGDPEK